MEEKIEKSASANRFLPAQESAKLPLKNPTSITEQVDQFLNVFNQMKAEISQDLKLSESVEKDNIAHYFDDVMIKMQKLQKYLADSSEFLPSYVIRTSSEHLKVLQESYLTQQSKCLPKKKFAFKSRIKESHKALEKISCNLSSDEVDSTDQKILPHLYCFKDEMGKILEKQSEDIAGQDLEIGHLSECTVLLFGTPNTVHFSGLKNCKLFLGPVKTSIFIEQCNSCIFVAACQQLRVHNTKACDFYLHIISNPIIEDCSEMRFGPYTLEYKLLKKHFSESGLDFDTNKWDKVNDFNWLALNTKSPNWVTIPVEERCTWSF